MNTKNITNKSEVVKVAFDYLKTTAIQDVDQSKWPIEVMELLIALDDESTVSAKAKQTKKEYIDLMNKEVNDNDKLLALSKNALLREYLEINVPALIKSVKDPILLAFLINLGVSEEHEKEIVEKIKKSEYKKTGNFEIGNDTTLIYTLLAKHGEKLDGIKMDKILWGDDLSITKVLEGYSNLMFFYYYSGRDLKDLVAKIQDLYNRLISIQNFLLIDVLLEIELSFIAHINSKDINLIAAHWMTNWTRLYNTTQLNKIKPVATYNDANNQFMDQANGSEYYPTQAFKKLLRSMMNQKMVLSDKGRDKIFNSFNHNAKLFGLEVANVTVETFNGKEIMETAQNIIVKMLSKRFEIAESNIHEMIVEIAKEDLKNKRFDQERQNFNYEMLLVWFTQHIEEAFKQHKHFIVYTMYITNFIVNKYITATN